MNEIMFEDGTKLFFSQGTFDEWCVYEVEVNGIKRAPKDIEYFSELLEFSKIFNEDKIYDDFKKIYEMTNRNFEKSVVAKIKKLSQTYGEHSLEINKIFSTLYMGMIAEENKKNTKLGKRIKRLGIHNLLKNKKSPEYCADFMKGKGWREIDALCTELGF